MTTTTETRFTCTECDRSLTRDYHYGGKGNCCTSCYLEIYEMKNEIADLVKELNA